MRTLCEEGGCVTTLPPAEVLAALGSGIPLPDGGIPAALDGAAGMRHAGIPFTDARVSTLPDASILSRRGIYIRLYGRPPRPLREASWMPGAPRSSPVDYRLAAEDPFPAAVEDALSVYHYLLERGYSATQLVPVGISAGGTLVLPMLLAGRRPGLLMPATGRSAITG